MKNTTVTADTANKNTQNNETNEKAYRYTAYALFGLGFAFVLIVICMYHRIRLAIAIIKTAS
jgi:solute carrier family 44 protein 1 (choline transporter-like protein)